MVLEKDPMYIRLYPVFVRLLKGEPIKNRTTSLLSFPKLFPIIFSIEKERRGQIN